VLRWTPIDWQHPVQTSDPRATMAVAMAGHASKVRLPGRALGGPPRRARQCADLGPSGKERFARTVLNLNNSGDDRVSVW